MRACLIDPSMLRHRSQRGPYTRTSHAPVRCVKGPDGVGRARVQAHQPCHQQVDVEHERAAAPPVSLPSRGIRTVRSPSTRAADPASAGAAGRFAGCPCPELRAVGAQIFLRYFRFSRPKFREICVRILFAL